MLGIFNKTIKLLVKYIIHIAKYGKLLVSETVCFFVMYKQNVLLMGIPL